jgi:hypothetical protein
MPRSALLLVLVSGCFGGYRYTPTTATRSSAREPSCQFEILRTRPQREYLELGALDVKGDVTASPHDVATFRKLVQRSVCAAGGDAVLAVVNGFGAYVSGTVIKYR